MVASSSTFRSVKVVQVIDQSRAAFRLSLEARALLVHANGRRGCRMHEMSMKWTARAFRLFGVQQRACERNVNDVRARVGIPNWMVQRGLIEQRARRATFAIAMPFPRGK